MGSPALDGPQLTCFSKRVAAYSHKYTKFEVSLEHVCSKGLAVGHCRVVSNSIFLAALPKHPIYFVDGGVSKARFKRAKIESQVQQSSRQSAKYCTAL